MKVKKRNKIAVLVICVGVVAILVINDLFFFGGNIRFYTKWIECGSKPLVGAGKPGIKWYEESSTFDLVRGQTWFCTPLEAEQAGYSANEYSWDRPHLREYLRQQGE